MKRKLESILLWLVRICMTGSLLLAGYDLVTQNQINPIVHFAFVLYSTVFVWIVPISETTRSCWRHRVNKAQTNFEHIKSMDKSELARFLESCINGDNNHGIGCWGCIDYGTHHYQDGDCEFGYNRDGDGCEYYHIGTDIEKWLDASASDEAGEILIITKRG